ncbi:MAG: hypothetical protein ACRC68_03910 [Clostridium sp.]
MSNTESHLIDETEYTPKINIAEENDDKILVHDSTRFNDILDGKVYVLQNDINLNGRTINPQADITFVLDLNGYKIIQETNQYNNSSCHCILIDKDNTKMLITDYSHGIKGKITSSVVGFATVEVKSFTTDSLVVIDGGVTIETQNDFAINNNYNVLVDTGFIFCNCNIISEGPYPAIAKITCEGDALLFTEEGHGAVCSEDLRDIYYN